MALSALSTTIAKSKRPLLNTVALFALLALAFLPELALADDTTQTKVCGFFGSIKTILNAASIVVVTVAVIFSGYQIAFAHKRIADVTPALIGGVMIGAAAQIAKTVVGSDNDECGATSGTSLFLMDVINSAIHLVSFHA
ncbi:MULTISPECIES: TrbC/VirB2 family protein [Rhodanobacteraceae]|uniref:TrbC/VirB2 family protein n=1 Tax=Rhodanobacteraceae TaxID=1775411 RepID=UPI0005B9322A|nr:MULTISPECIES: TrbC/VirB2 family protein [Rhodanobacteraceae]SDH03545.1 type IV secretion system protein VirB2 [Dyella sp. 333MFSha]SKC05668.1 type IV secretion system protein VirB2 [Luteibacter sp. 22Crub2.1]